MGCPSEGINVPEVIRPRSRLLFPGSKPNVGTLIEVCHGTANVTDRVLVAAAQCRPGCGPKLGEGEPDCRWRCAQPWQSSDTAMGPTCAPYQGSQHVRCLPLGTMTLAGWDHAPGNLYRRLMKGPSTNARASMESAICLNVTVKVPGRTRASDRAAVVIWIDDGC